MQKKRTYRATFYEPGDLTAWNELVAGSRNGTFLFDRGFMDYHAHRFTDASVVVRIDGKMVAGLPAHLGENRVRSHGGLTYGGFFYADGLRIGEVFAAFAAVLELLHESGHRVLDLKPVPAIYHKMPSDEILQALFYAGARLTDRQALLVVDNRSRIAVPKSRRQAIMRGVRNGLEIRETDDLAAFWDQILVPNLQRRYQTLPVHSLGEISLLRQRFPQQIRQFNVYEQGRIVAGTTVFETEMAAHPQYVSAVEDRSRNGAVDFLYDHLLNEVFPHKRYFDFGTSALEGNKMSADLVFWKEQFGGRAIVQDRYEVDTANYQPLHEILV